MVDLILLPYDSGKRAVRIGRGPEHFIHSGLPERLQAGGHDVRGETLGSEVEFPTATAVAVDLALALAKRVHRSRESGNFPLVLTGNCMSAPGMVSGLGAEQVAVFWFDCHGDFNTPDTSRSGFLDEIALAVIVGRCWSGMAETVPGLAPLAESRVVLVGTRNLNKAEEQLLANSGVKVVGPRALQGGTREVLGPPLEELASSVGSAYVHVDLDVVDPGAMGRVNRYAAPGRLLVEEVRSAVRRIATRCKISGATISAYDPSFDMDGRVLEAGVEIIEQILKSAVDFDSVAV